MSLFPSLVRVDSKACVLRTLVIGKEPRASKEISCFSESRIKDVNF